MSSGAIDKVSKQLFERLRELILWAEGIMAGSDEGASADELDKLARDTLEVTMELRAAGFYARNNEAQSHAWKLCYAIEKYKMSDIGAEVSLAKEAHKYLMAYAHGSVQDPDAEDKRRFLELEYELKEMGFALPAPPAP